MVLRCGERVVSIVRRGGAGALILLVLLMGGQRAGAQDCVDGVERPCLINCQAGIQRCALGRWSPCLRDPQAPPPPPGVTISEGPQVTASDLAQFDARWTPEHEGFVRRTRDQILARCDFCGWELAERMHALARIYDLTHDERYLVQLRELIGPALEFRDDKSQGGTTSEGQVIPPPPADQFRGRVMPAWGGQSVNYANLHRVDEVISSLYGYALAAYARIVFEHPPLWARHGPDAVRFANAVIETVWAFLPQLGDRTTPAGVEARLESLQIYATRPTLAECYTAYQAELDRVGGDAAGRSRAEQMHKNCTDLHIGAGTPLAHNENLAFAMMLIELSRALDSSYYRNSADRSPDAESTRTLLPVLVARQHRYFFNRLRPVDGPNGGRYEWNYSDDLPPGLSPWLEDTSHGTLDMRYVELVSRDLARLNAAAAPFGESISLGPAQLRRFANTFLQKIAQGDHLALDITGASAAPGYGADGACHGWAGLAAADPEVHRACARVTFRVDGCRQPVLGIGNHAALLATKRFAPEPVTPAVVPDVRELGTTAAAALIRAAGLVPVFTGSGTWVGSQSPAAGTVVARGSTVRCVRRSGPRP
jgi:PASTA domain-containing protein